MHSETNPLIGVRDLDFTRHALFRMKDSGVSEFEVYQIITSPAAEVKRDSKSGHIVFRSGAYRVVAKKDSGEHATVITFTAADETL